MIRPRNRTCREENKKKEEDVEFEALEENTGRINGHFQTG